ncbi:hypothetical protein F992_00831 [Acinetobacter modestus]|uniref:DUF805 domain-containing protein n=2 Tax=Acinetobacter modestus TaxID=1776740 RepID=A0ABN0JRU4_9GAMM|nr:hypothetical protein F992_00831 [Acinetobacter modestus]GGA21717.1 hypothetical protein GCM10017554_18470 [Acinetobacter modestus]
MFYVWMAFFLNDKMLSMVNIWGVINWLIFWIIPVVNHIYLVGKNKPAIKIVNWFFSIFYMMYLYPIFNGFVGQKLVVQPAYIISMYCFIIAMKDTFMDPIHKK